MRSSKYEKDTNVFQIALKQSTMRSLCLCLGLVAVFLAVVGIVMVIWAQVVRDNRVELTKINNKIN